MRITFRNDLPDDPSNLHYHGMSVSPQGNSDNVFVHVHPGQQFQRTGRQGPGLFWYHPHAHGFVEKQILGGMSGGLIVDGSDQLYPMLRGLKERFFFIKHIETGTDSELISINGQINPAVQIRPDETHDPKRTSVASAGMRRRKSIGLVGGAVAAARLSNCWELGPLRRRIGRDADP